MFGYRQRPTRLGIAALLAVIAAISGFVWWWNQPSPLRIVVPDRAQAERLMLVSLQDVFRRERAGVTINLLDRGEAKPAGHDGPLTPEMIVQAVARGRADMAMVRLDAAPAGSLRQVVLVRREAVVFVLPHGSEITTVAGLEGQVIGIAPYLPVNRDLAYTILEQYGLARDAVTLVPLQPAEAGGQPPEQRPAAALVIGAPTLPHVREAVAHVARAGRGEPVFLPVEMPEAVGGRSPRFEMLEVQRAAYGSGGGPRPAEAINTLAVTVRLMARADVSTTVVQEFVEHLLANRARLAIDAPIASLIEAADTEADAVVSPHRGAVAHANGERRGFIDRFENWFYLLLFFGSTIASMFAGLMSLGSGEKSRLPVETMTALAEMIGRARAAADPGELDAIEEALSEKVAAILNCAAEGLLEDPDAKAIELGVDELRATITRRRAKLAAQPPQALPAAAE